MPKCKHCKAPYERTRNGIETWCSVECGYQLARLKQAQAFKKETRVMRKKLNESSVKWVAKRAKHYCHLYIRTLYANEPCFTCGTREDVVYAAGHFIPSGRAAALRYDERNIRKQCNNYCNKNLSGNVTVYRAKLVSIHGEEYVQELERIGHTKKTWKIPELQEVIEYYKRKLKELNV